jgi:hypothetical protein
MIRSASRWHSLTLVGQSTWKAQVLGYGAASKEHVALWMRENERRLFNAATGEDELDAMCIGLYGVLRAQGAILPPEGRKKTPTRIPTRQRITPSGEEGPGATAKDPTTPPAT